MAKLEYKGLDEYMSRLEKLEKSFVPVLKQSVYEGTGIVADAVNAEIDSLPGRLPIPLKLGLGIAKMEVDGGEVHAKVGFDGYYDEERYGTTAPIPLIARAIAKGTSTIQKNDFIKRAKAKAQTAAMAAMEKTIIEKVNSIMEDL